MVSSTAGWSICNSKPLGEFVIAHELVHLLAPNHGKVFKSFMSAYQPGWEEREEMLRGMGVSDDGR
jgi:predicted metal-dependent hydrolase